MNKRLLWLCVVIAAILLHAETGHSEYDMVEIPCRPCKGTGNCQTCGNDPAKKKTCVQCYYSGNCLKCGGTRVEMVSRFEAERLGYRR
jgi:hypothetical protein